MTKDATAVAAIRKAVDELGTNAVCRDLWTSAEGTLGRPIGKDEFFRALDHVMDEVKGRARRPDDLENR